MGLCVLYYVEYSLYNVKKVGFFLSGLELHFNIQSARATVVVTGVHTLTIYQTTNFRLVQVKTNCRRHFKVNLK